MTGPAGDELTQLIKQIAGQQIIDYKPHVYGYIASYDDVGHKVKVIIPSLRDQDGAPVLSEWMPLGAAAVGNGFGIQMAPFGGATADNPTGGEQVLISMFDRDRGVLAAPCMFYTDVMQAPSTALSAPLRSGEILLFNKSGSFIRLHASGDITVASPTVINLTAPEVVTSENLVVGTGATGSFTAATGEVVTVQDGIIINIT